MSFKSLLNIYIFFMKMSAADDINYTSRPAEFVPLQPERAAHCVTVILHNIIIILTSRLKAGIAEPEYTFIAKQRLGKLVPVATNKQATIEVLLSYNDGNGVFC
jgi:hypothetical protein